MSSSPTASTPAPPTTPAELDDADRPLDREPIPVTVLAGFLGSGKTTLLNRLLTERHGQRVAVVVNEFGDVGIDGALVSGGERFVELDNGCLCCALNDDLQAALRELSAVRDELDARQGPSAASEHPRRSPRARCRRRRRIGSH